MITQSKANSWKEKLTCPDCKNVFKPELDKTIECPYCRKRANFTLSNVINS